MVKPENLYIKRNRVLTALSAGICLALAAVMITVLTVAVLKHQPESRGTLIILVAGISLFSLILLLIAVLNFRNLFFPYILTADEKGIYNYSGYHHFGFIKWEDIASFGSEATVLDVMDSEMPSIRIFFRDFRQYKSTLSFAKKWIIFWSGCNVKIYTLTSSVKRKQLLIALNEMLRYYGNPEGVQE